MALNPHTNKSDVLKAPHNKIPAPVSPNKSTDSSISSRDWFESTGYTEQYIQSYDSLSLHSYIILQPQESNQWVLIAHGYTGSGKQMTASAKRFFDHGYHVMLPDARGHGKSEGNYIGMGWHDRLDYLAWINLIITKYPDAQIVLYGISMGAATVMMVAGEHLPKNVKVIIEDCGYTSIYDEFAYQLRELYHLPTFPIMQFSSIVTKVRANFTFKEGNALSQVAKSQVPMMFIHGDQDTFVPSSMLEGLYQTAKTDKEKLLVTGAGHSRASAVLGDEYWKRVFQFTNQFVI